MAAAGLNRGNGERGAADLAQLTAVTISEGISWNAVSFSHSPVALDCPGGGCAERYLNPNDAKGAGAQQCYSAILEARPARAPRNNPLDSRTG